MSANGPPTVPDSLAACFEDFDLEEVFRKATPHAESPDSRNFVVEFGPEHARIAFDVDSKNIERLLKSERDAKNYPIRWMYDAAPNPIHHSRIIY